MSLESVIQEAIEKGAEAIIPLTITQGVVTKVDKETNTCNVERENMPELFKVRLNAIVSPGANVITVYPQVGSKVLVGLVENIKTDAYMLSATDIESIIINGGENGGIAISQTFIDEIQEIKDDLNALKTTMSTWAPVAQDGGASLKTALADWYTETLADLDAEAMVNDKIQH